MSFAISEVQQDSPKSASMKCQGTDNLIPSKKWDGLIFFYQRWVRLWFDITVLIIEYASELYLGKKKRLYIHTILSHPITEKKQKSNLVNNNYSVTD